MLCSTASVRANHFAAHACGLPIPASEQVCLYLYLGYHPDRRRCIASEHRAWPLVTSFSPLHIYVAPQHLVVTSIHRAGVPAVSGPLASELCTILQAKF